MTPNNSQPNIQRIFDDNSVQHLSDQDSQQSTEKQIPSEYPHQNFDDNEKGTNYLTNFNDQDFIYGGN